MTLRTPAKFIASFGYVGLLPGAPGTYGSLAAVAVWWFFVPADNLPVQIILVIAATVAGLWAAEIMEQSTGAKDPGWIVIDEVAGMWLALLGSLSNLWYFAGAFVLFRLFDILKPGPINRLQGLRGGVGVMADDIAAGALTLGIMLLIRKFL